jgi:hypothetical protein
MFSVGLLNCAPVLIQHAHPPALPSACAFEVGLRFTSTRSSLCEDNASIPGSAAAILRKRAYNTKMIGNNKTTARYTNLCFGVHAN